MGVANVITRFSDKRFSLASGYLTRELDIAGAWNKVRIGVLTQVNASATILNTTLFVGLCSGLHLGIGTLTPKHAVGVSSNPAVSSTYTFTTNRFTALSVFPFKNVLGTKTYGALNIGNPINYNTAAQIRSLLFIDITKGSPDYTFQLFHRNAVDALDVTESDFTAQMVLASPTQTGHTFGTARTQAVDEAADGVLDCFNVQWGHLGYPLEIAALGVYVLS